ncbi:preprotein translocase subunit SecG [Candidatus Parcubacteria bacterium]|nr:MAG: preprotein translocase subunit SecG [Candidatus Parcubacteria bacterium]
MSSILPLLPYVQVLLAALLIVAILLQQRGASLGGAFGGDNFSAAFYTRRGPELLLFRASIVLAIALVGSVASQFVFAGM